MARIHELLRQLRTTGDANASLADEIEREYDVVSDRRAFGLNFERHTPEAVELPGRPVRTGDKVHVLPARGSMPTKENDRLWRVTSIDGTGSDRIARLEPYPTVDDGSAITVPTSDLVVVAEFRDPIYPGLVSTGKVERGGDKPYHAVINAENFHALQTLLFTHRGKVDAIYIDPPYNTGAKDWKYNNDYVEGDDLYRHSKWLAFMERRLLLARELLNSDDAVLIITIDEKEYLRLGLLLEQTFPEARITMVTSSVNSAGSARSGTFGRSAEYLYFVQFGASRPASLALSAEWNPVQTDNKSKLRWHGLRRRGVDGLRAKSPNLFYPIYVRNTDEGPVFHSIGEPYFGSDWQTQPSPPGTTAIWPIRQNLDEGRWSSSPQHLRNLISEGHARLGRWQGLDTAVEYLSEGERAKVREGVFPIVGHKVDGSVQTDSTEYSPKFVPTDIWRLTAHDASNSGSRLLSKYLPNRHFPFPKSLYAVEDALRFFLTTKPTALVVDFFSGSGTTAHAVMRLNHQDDGRRVSISVTNNEVSADEQKRLRKTGLRPGDPEWEEWGICDYITKPRIRAAITGNTPDGRAINGDYKFTDEFPMAQGLEENVEFFTMTYEAPLRLRANRDFERIAPLLWLRAGSRGSRIESLTKGWAVAEAYGVLSDLDKTEDLLSAIRNATGVTHAFLITDDDAVFEAIVAELPGGVEPVRLYDSYLRNFEIDAMRSVR